MSKSMFTLSAAVAAVALAPLAAQAVDASGLPSIYGDVGEYANDQGNCTAEVPPNDPLMASGRIVAIDPAAGRVTLDYRPLPLLPEGGVRIFAVENPAILKGLRPGDRVRFEVEREDRSYVVTRLENSN